MTVKDFQAKTNCASIFLASKLSTVLVSLSESDFFANFRGVHEIAYCQCYNMKLWAHEFAFHRKQQIDDTKSIRFTSCLPCDVHDSKLL